MQKYTAPLLPEIGPKCANGQQNPTNSVQHIDRSERAKNGAIPAASRNVLDRLEKQFLTSRAYAQVSGIPQAAIEADVQAGMKGLPRAISGQTFADYTLVQAWELDAVRVAFHKARLAERGNAAPCADSQCATSTSTARISELNNTTR